MGTHIPGHLCISILNKDTPVCYETSTYSTPDTTKTIEWFWGVSNLPLRGINNVTSGGARSFLSVPPWYQRERMYCSQTLGEQPPSHSRRIDGTHPVYWSKPCASCTLGSPSPFPQSTTGHKPEHWADTSLYSLMGTVREDQWRP